MRVINGVGLRACIYTILDTPLFFFPSASSFLDVHNQFVTMAIIIIVNVVAHAPAGTIDLAQMRDTIDKVSPRLPPLQNLASLVKTLAG